MIRPPENHLRLSDSSLAVKRSCARKLEFRKFYEHSSREETLPTGAGKAIHAGFQTWLTTGNKDDAIWAMMAEFPIKFSTTPFAGRSIEACYATLLAMINKEGFGRYELATFQVGDELRPGIEVPFELLFKDFFLDEEQTITVSYVGFIDLVVWDRVDECYGTIDIKSTTIAAPDLSPLYKFNNQCIPYEMVIQRLLAKPIEQLTVKYLTAQIDIMTPLVREYVFEKSELDLQDWARSLHKDLRDIREFAQQNWFPRNGASCYAWKRVCPHFQFCETRDAKTIEVMLETQPKYEAKKIEPWITIDVYLGEIA